MTIKSKIKDHLIDIQLRLYSQEPVFRKLQDIASQANTEIPNLRNHPSPYNLIGTLRQSSTLRDDAIFITSRFRSGSTFLWNIFRQAGGFTAYYEPLNERKWFDEALRGNRVDSTHRGVEDYWSEYNGLHELKNLYNEDWIRYRLLMSAREHDPDMRAYIECLVNRAPYRPVLQFNRIDFRLGWIKANFPTAKLIHLYRHPRDQWCSFLTDIELMNKNNVERTYSDGFYLNMWCNDLAIHFPFLDSRKTPHPYQRFYYLWKLSYLFGRHYADYSMSFEELVLYPEEKLQELFSIINVENPPIEKLTRLISAPKLDKWKSYAESEWFEHFEQECEQQLNLFFAEHPSAKFI